MNLEKKIEKVKEIIKDKKIAIAFSGGADSTLMCYLASKVCKDPLAITIDNNIFPKGFIENTKEICNKFGIKQEIIFEDFYNHKNITSNNHDRCFLCRKEMYKHITKIANDHIIVDGTNITDLVADRPGILINYENNIKSPFVKAKLTSKEIHEYLDKNNIHYSKSTTCLATRIPFGETFNKEKYNRISDAEQIIYDNTNCKIVKVREKYPDCIVEVDNLMEFSHANKINLIKTQLKEVGYKKVIIKTNELEEYEELQLNFIYDKFIYQLPYEVDLEKTKINNENILVTDDGTILGKNFKSYEEATDEFMNILPKIRRKSI